MWSYSIQGHVPGSPAIGPDGVVRVHSSDGLLHGVGPNGERAWPPVDVGPPLGWASPLVDASGNAYVCSAAGGIVKIDRNGTPPPGRPFFRSPFLFNSTGLIFDNVLYIGTEFDSCIFAVRLDGERGENLWDHGRGQGRTAWSINGALALAPGPVLVVPCRDDHLYAFGLDGTLRWKFPVPGQLRGSFVIDERQGISLGVSHGSISEPERGELVSIDVATQQVRFRYEADGPVESTPTLGDDGTIYFGDNAGAIHALDPRGGLVWKQKVGSPVRSSGTIAEPGVLVYGLDNGTLVALNCPSARLAAKIWPKFLGSRGQSGLCAEG
jgi:outer membrane protein assembly factor BamB